MKFFIWKHESVKVKIGYGEQSLIGFIYQNGLKSNISGKALEVVWNEKTTEKDRIQESCYYAYNELVRMGINATGKEKEDLFILCRKICLPWESVEITEEEGTQEDFDHFERRIRANEKRIDEYLNELITIQPDLPADGNQLLLFGE